MVSARMLILGFFLLYHHIVFSSADEVFTDELLSFNAQDIDPFRDSTSTYLFDATNSIQNPDLFSDANFSDDDDDDDDENSDLFDILANSGPNLNSDLFVSDANLDSIIDPTSFDIADCGPINNGVLRRDKNTRVRRETACHNPQFNSDPSLSLPTLDQVNREDPLRPKTEDEKKRADAINNFFLRTGLFPKATDIILRECHREDEKTICNSGKGIDILLEGNGETYTLLTSTRGKCFLFSFFFSCSAKKEKRKKKRKKKKNRSNVESS